jgi:tetratricopeptide (TPR) repeat protein
MDGYFRKPVSLDHMGYDLVVLDTLDCAITLFSLTDFGALVFDAMDKFDDGKYDESRDLWEQVIQLNGNYDLAYIGLGKAYLRQKKYKEAMDYFKVKRDRRDYSKAFKYYRKEWIEKNIGWMVGLLIVIIVLSFVLKIVKKIKWELDTL